MSFSMLFLKCNLETGRESYGLENTGISRGTGISRATGNSRNSGIPEAQTFPARFPGTGISREFPARGFPLNITGMIYLKSSLYFATNIN